MKKSVLYLTLKGSLATAFNIALADSNCAALPNHAALKTALIAARSEANGGFNLDM